MTEFYNTGGYGLGLYDGADPIFDFDGLTKYYISLLIIQYITKARARNTVGVFVESLVANKVIEKVRDGFDLDTAVGAQLDILAAYRGANRVVYGLDLSRDYFAMPYYDDPSPETLKGFALYGDTVDWYWILYADAERPVYAMTDDELRRLTKLLAKTQSRSLSVEEISDILFEFFGTNVDLVDNGDMTITYVHALGDPDTLFYIASQTGHLPKPSGVKIILA